MATVNLRGRRWLAAVAALPLAVGLLAALPASPATAAAGGSAAVPKVHCTSDNSATAGNRVQLVYAYEAEQADRSAERDAQIKFSAWGAEQHVNDSGRRDGKERWIRWVTTGSGTGSNCTISVLKIQVPKGQEYGSSDSWMTTLRNAGLNRNDRIYAIFAENDTTDCGITWTDQPVFDPSPGTGNFQNYHPFYSTIVPGCFTPHNLSHELAHAMFATTSSMPGTSGDAWGHCAQGMESLCAVNPPNLVCGHPLDGQRWDCNGDDYFSTKTTPNGTWLPTHWNAAKDSLYFEAGQSVTAQPIPKLFAPQLLKAVDVEGSSIAFTWKPSSTPVGDHNYTLTYEILREKDGAKYIIATVDGLKNDARVTGLPTGSSSRYTVRAKLVYNGTTQISAESMPLIQATNNSTAWAGAAETNASFILNNGLKDGFGTDFVIDVYFESRDEDAGVVQHYRKNLNNQIWAMTSTGVKRIR
ncbi:fibronectin type III domain-containing protein [Luedemannella flava]